MSPRAPLTNRPDPRLRAEARAGAATEAETAGTSVMEGPDAAAKTAAEAADPFTRLATLVPTGLLDRRRASFLLGTFAAAWIVLLFARQVGDAAAATATADALRTENAAVSARVEALEAERLTVAQPRYVAQQARGYELGGAGERAFMLAPNAPALAVDAPGSAAVRLGARPEPSSNLEVWLTLLFGPGRG